MRLWGILLPADWNDDGQVTAMILATSDEAEFPIKSDKSPAQLKRYFRKKVIVDGELAASGFFTLRSIGFYEVDLESAAESSI
jgi:hypothetical protein